MYQQHVDNRGSLTPHPYIDWNIVKDDEDRECIIISTEIQYSSSNYLFPMVLYLCLPYGDAELNKTNSTHVTPSMLMLGSHYQFLKDGQVSSYMFLPLEISVTYTKKEDGYIQGTFTADGGEINTRLRGPIRIKLEDGVFNLRHGSRFNPNFSLADWCKDKDELQNSYAPRPYRKQNVLDETTWFTDNTELRFASPCFQYVMHDEDEIQESYGGYSVTEEAIILKFYNNLVKVATLTDNKLIIDEEVFVKVSEE